MTGSLHEALEVVKQHEVENTARFSAYSVTKDCGSTGK